MQSVLGFTAVDDAAAKMTVRLAETIEIEEKYFHSRNGRSGKFVKCVATAIDRAAEGPVSGLVRRRAARVPRPPTLHCHQVHQGRRLGRVL